MKVNDRKYYNWNWNTSKDFVELFANESVICDEISSTGSGFRLHTPVLQLS